MIGLVLVTHGRLAAEFVTAMEHVVGPQEAIAAICIGPEDDMEARRADIAAAVAEVDRGDGVTILPYNLAKQTVILIRQFRYPAYANGYDGLLVEAPAGSLDDAEPEARIRSEAEEEIGLDRAHIEPLGYLDVYMTTLGYRIVPVIARVKPGFELTLNTGEVDNVFEVPLTYVMDMANMQRHAREWQGMTRHYYAITFGERYIWGVTAGILRNLYDRVYRE